MDLPNNCARTEYSIESGLHPSWLDAYKVNVKLTQGYKELTSRFETGIWADK